MSDHLRDHEHPYYCSEGNYYVAGYKWGDVHTDYDSWSDFYEDWGDSDPELNLVFRWDWNRYDPECAQPDEPRQDYLQIFFVLQRKAILRSCKIWVTPEDEPAVRAWLAERVETIRAIWSPLLDAPGEGCDTP